MAEPLYIDNSTLKAVAACSTRALMRYVHGYTSAEERATLKAGLAFHEAMAVYFATGGDAGAAMAALAAAYQVWATDTVPADDRLAWDNVRRITERWLETHALGTLPFHVSSPEMVEIGFAYPLTNAGDIVACGRLDGLVTYTADSALYILEHKTTGNIDRRWLGQYTMDSQLSHYIWAAQMQTDRPVVGAILNAVEFSKLPNSDRKCKVHGVMYKECGIQHANMQVAIIARGPEQLADWRKTAIKLARRFVELRDRYPVIEAIRLAPQEGMFSNQCRDCEFQTWCQLGRPLDYLERNLVIEPWSPYDRSQHATPTA